MKMSLPYSVKTLVLSAGCHVIIIYPLTHTKGFAQKIESRWKSFLCGPLRISAFSALMGLSTQRAQRYAEAAEKTNQICHFFCKARQRSRARMSQQSSVTLRGGRSSGSLSSRVAPVCKKPQVPLR